jgi:hypothetical protein
VVSIGLVVGKTLVVGKIVVSIALVVGRPVV